MGAGIFKGVNQFGNVIYKLRTDKNTYTITALGKFNLYVVSRVPTVPTYEQRHEYHHGRRPDGEVKAPGEDLFSVKFEDEQQVLAFLNKKLRDEHPPRKWQP